jgi:hypothetical protein
VQRERARDGRLGLFAALYRQVTIAVKQGIDEGRFEDGARMERLDVAFAGRYFAAYEAWRAKRPLSSAWRVAFEASTRRETCLLQDVLLGINAHINLDLGIAASLVADGDSAALKRDFFMINELLEELVDDVEAVFGRFSPIIGVLDYVGGRADERAGSFVIGLARDESWRHVRALAGLTAEARARYITEVDEFTWRLGQRIIAPPGPIRWALRLIRATERRPMHEVIDAIDSVMARRERSARDVPRVVA